MIPYNDNLSPSVGPGSSEFLIRNRTTGITKYQAISYAMPATRLAAEPMALIVMNQLGVRLLVSLA